MCGSNDLKPMLSPILLIVYVNKHRERKKSFATSYIRKIRNVLKSYFLQSIEIIKPTRASRGNKENERQNSRKRVKGSV